MSLNYLKTSEANNQAVNPPANELFLRYIFPCRSGRNDMYWRVFWGYFPIPNWIFPTPFHPRLIFLFAY